MLVNTKTLNSWTQEGFMLSDEAERRICEMVFGDVVDHVSSGNVPEYDVMLENGIKIEVKFTDSNKIFIETERYNGDPSGLSVSEAAFYLIVQAGYHNQKIGKVKLISTEELRKLGASNICETKEYKPWKSGSPGARGFVIDRELGQNDGWLGNIGYDLTSSSFDLSRWTYRKPKKK